MAIEALSRWQMIREIILENRSGTLIVQLGKNFLHWMITEGKVICISSTLPEYSLTQFLLTYGKPERSQLLKAQGLIHDQRSLGSALVDSNSLTAEQLSVLLEEHRASLSHHLLQASSHLFWSDRQVEYKHHFVRFDESLQKIVLSADRSFIDTRAAIRVAQNLPVHYRVTNWTAIEKHFLEPEKRLLNYLKSNAPLAAMLKDPELDRMTCYRMLFLLWLAGALQEPAARKGRIAAAAPPRISLMKRARSLPPDWIFPLIAGVIIGALLAPGPSRSSLARSPQHIESLRDAIDKPAWQTEENHEDTKSAKKHKEEF
jgi:hypothetical protein